MRRDTWCCSSIVHLMSEESETLRQNGRGQGLFASMSESPPLGTSGLTLSIPAASSVGG
jgi:hypothetical protein